jgi:predicted NUDIX family NTP pyrophosphohydrolase
MQKDEIERKIVQATCPIMYRMREKQIEFCLLLIDGDSRWEFPHGSIRAGEAAEVAASRIVHQQFGVNCRVDAEPLGEFHIQRNDVVFEVTALLAECIDGGVSRHGRSRRVRRWFLLDEARQRLRRKPMRHCADVAKRRVKTNVEAVRIIDAGGRMTA